MIKLLQKRVGHEPEIWEDMKFGCREDPNRQTVIDDVLDQFVQLEALGTYRLFFDDGSLVIFDIYRRELIEARIDGVVQSHD